MPKVEKNSGADRAAARQMRAHPAKANNSGSNKKKKQPAAAVTGSGKSSSSSSGGGGKSLHSSSLESDLLRLADPGKLKPIRAGEASSAQRKKKKEVEDQMEEDREEDDLDLDIDDDEGPIGASLDARLSKKILQQVDAQQKEELEGEGEEEEAKGNGKNSSQRLKQLISLRATVDGDEDMTDPDDDDDDEDHDEAGIGLDEEEVEEMELSPEDQASLEMFMPKSNTLKAKSLADIILDKIREKEEMQAVSAGGASAPGSNVRFGAGFGTGAADAQEMVRSKLDPKIVEVYSKVGKFLSHYSSGKVPKAFKLIPNLKSWEEILFLTNPDTWTVQAYFVATRIFSSNFNPKMAQRFYSLILLPKIRSDIESHKHLNFHLYQSIKKSLYKPAAFFKGLLLPLAEQDPSAREAVIMSSILSRCTIPMLHSSVALLKLSQLPYSGTVALFIKTLLNKKYSLPRKVLTSMVQYFCSYLHHSANGLPVGQMPLIWHQTLLCFVQRYKLELSVNQVTALKNLVKVQSHHAVSQEIRRELAAVNQAANPFGNGLSFSSTAGPLKIDSGSGSSGTIGHGMQTQTSFSFGLTPGFTSLAASMKNPEQFGICKTNADPQQMQQ